jgi:hypothetical protein
MGVRPDEPEMILITSDVIATSGVSLVIHSVFVPLNRVPNRPAPPLTGEHPEVKQAQVAYWSSVWGPIA